MSTRVIWFQSSTFPILPEEQEEVNPHIHGKSLAVWMGEKLRAAGFKTGEPFKEDFGWWTDVEAEPPHQLAFVCCGEEPNQWGVFATAQGGTIWDRVRGKEDPEVAAAPLHAALRKILEAESTIHSIEEE